MAAFIRQLQVDGSWVLLGRAGLPEHGSGGAAEPRGLQPAAQQEGYFPATEEHGGAGGSRGEPTAHRLRRWLAAPIRGPSLAADRITQAVTGLNQLLVGITQWQKTAGGLATRAQPVLVAAMFLVGFLFMALCPRFYMRNRPWLLPTLRILIVLPSSARNIGVGTALLMENAATPGLRGLLRDTMRVGMGIRMLPHAVLSFFMPLAVLETLCMHGVLVVLTWNSEAYCATQLARDPLSQQRQAAIAAWLEAPLLPLAAVQPLAAPLLHTMPDQLPPEALCSALVSFYHIVLGLVVPVLWAAYSQPAASWKQRGTPGSSSSNASSSSRVVVQRWLRSLLAAVSRAAEAGNYLIWRILAADSSPLLRCLVCWYVVANIWLLCSLPLRV